MSIADVCPWECYHRLKMTLLLSLVSSGSNFEDNTGNGMFLHRHRNFSVKVVWLQVPVIFFAEINLLVYGSDLKAIRQLLTIGSSLASNTVHHSSRNNLIPAYRKARLGTFIDGNLSYI